MRLLVFQDFFIPTESVLRVSRQLHRRLSTGLILAPLLALILAGCGSLYGSRSLHPPSVSFVTVDTDPDWSPDGKLLAFASSRWFGGICLIRPDGTGLRQIFHGNASDVDWSPDGRRIAFQGAGGIYVTGRRGGKPKRILRGQRFSLPAWAPDGRRLAVVADEPDLSMAIDVVNADGSALRRLLPPYVRKSNRHWGFVSASETEPSWSPDGRQIAMQAGDRRIVVVDVASGRRRTIAEGGYEPAWSPDGQLIAFQSKSGLWVANADGSGDPRELAENGGDPSWAPDSRSLVFEATYWYGRYWRRPQGLSVVGASGSGLRKLTYGHSVDDDPSWRGDLWPG
jgi:Tol biopolymer transport system component